MEKGNELSRISTLLERMLDSIQYGTVTLVIQDGKVVQIERSEKVRIEK